MVMNIFGRHIMFDAFEDETATHTQVTKFVSPWGLVVSIALWPVISSRKPLQTNRHLSCHSLFATCSTLDLNTFEHTKQEYEFSDVPKFLHSL
jgi:hypothetical protein